MTVLRLATLGAIAFSLAAPVLAQTAAEPATTLPGTVVMPDANAGHVPGTPPPGVTDPATTNSTTGTVDHEDHCQPPGTPTNTNPTADTVTIPRADPACK